MVHDKNKIYTVITIKYQQNMVFKGGVRPENYENIISR